VEETRTGVRVALASAGRASTATGLPVLDHLLGLLAEKACFDLALEVAPGGADAEVAAAGLALGQALAGPLRAEDAAGYGWAMVPARESLASVVLEVADEPGVLANVAQVLALQDVSVKSVVQKGLGNQARLVMVVHPVLESRFQAAMDLIAGLDIMRAPPRSIRVLEEEF
jgi:homoserine dehydrogenase